MNGEDADSVYDAALDDNFVPLFNKMIFWNEKVAGLSSKENEPQMLRAVLKTSSFFSPPFAREELFFACSPTLSFSNTRVRNY